MSCTPTAPSAQLPPTDGNKVTSARTGALITTGAPMASQASVKPMWASNDIAAADARNTRANNFRQSGTTWI